MPAPVYAPTTCTWDIDEADGGPRRPSLADVGGAQQIDATPAPHPTMPNSAMLNQHDRQHRAMGAVAPLLEVSVHYDSGSSTWSIVAFASPSTRLTLSDLSLIIDGDGDVTVFWPTALLPPPNVRPTAALNFDASGIPPTAPAAPMCGLTTDIGPPALTGARVVMHDHAGTLANYDFTVTVR